MSIHDETSEEERKMKHHPRKAKPDVAKAAMSEIEEIKDDLDSLKSNVVGLAHNLRVASADTARGAVQYVQERAETAAESIKAVSADAVENVEKRIKAQPGRSVAIAFASGVVISYILGRRSS